MTGVTGTEEYLYDGDGMVVRRKTTSTVSGGQFTDVFAASDAVAWTYSGHQTTPVTVDSRSTLRNSGTGTDLNANVYRPNYTLGDGRVVKFAFKLESANSNAHFSLETGSGSTYYRFGIVEAAGKLYLQVGLPNSVWLYPAVLVNSVAVGVWYGLELRIDDASGFQAAVWQVSAPGDRSEARYEMPTGKTWRFHHWAKTGNVYLDDYRELWAVRNPATTGVYTTSSGATALKHTNVAGSAEVSFTYGQAGDKPVAGDWNADGTKTIGIFRSGTFYLRNSNSAGVADITASFGLSTDAPVVGDWDGDGDDTIGVFRDGTWYLRNTNAAGAADISLTFGTTGDLPVVGDWDGDGIKTVGVFRPSTATFYLRNSLTSGSADVTVAFGQNGDKPVAGDWNADGVDTVGVFRSGAFLLRNTNTAGSADISFTLGGSNDEPIVGDWDGQSTTDSLTISRHYEQELITGVVTKRYYAGRLVATRSNGTLHYIQPDHLGSATTVTDATGQVVARERYSAFGERRRGEATPTTEYLYTDQRYSAFVGFYHYSSGGPGRMYDPLLGRFLQADPVTPGGGSQGLNRFAYVLNNPLTTTDSSGNWPEDSRVSPACLGIEEGGSFKILTGEGVGEADVASMFQVDGQRMTHYSRYDSLDEALTAAGLEYANEVKLDSHPSADGKDRQNAAINRCALSVLT